MKKTILLLAIALTTVSCNKLLDRPYDGRLSLDDIFNDFELTKGYVNKCYSYMPGGGIVNDYAMYYDGTLLASFCDEAQDTRDVQSGMVQNWYSGSITASSFPMADFWNLYYEAIRTCNTFLSRIESAPFLAGRPAWQGEAEEWKAQVYALRAFYFWQIVKRYGPAPIITEEMDDGYDFSRSVRSPFYACAEAVVADCESALDCGLGWNIGAGLEGDKGRMTLAFTCAVQSQAALYAASELWNTGSEDEKKARREWAATVTGNSLNQCIMNGYELFSDQPAGDALASSQSAYQTYFFSSMDIDRQKDKETIYESKIQLAVWRDAGLPSSASSIRAGSCPSQELVDAYEMADGTSPFEVDADGCVIYTGLEPNVSAGSSYDPSDPYAGRDPRLAASVFHNGSLLNFQEPSTAVDIYRGGDCAVSQSDQRHTRTGYYLRKFHHNRSNSDNRADGYLKIFRLGELYLNFAEAANEAYGPEYFIPDVEGSVKTALTAVNAVRARAGMPDFPDGLTREEFRTKYRNERRVELAFEQSRFYDVRRWNILEKTDARITGMNAVKNSDGTFDYPSGRFIAGERRCNGTKFLMFPIPVSEVGKMEYYTGVNWQNPLW